MHYLILGVDPTVVVQAPWWSAVVISVATAITAVMGVVSWFQARSTAEGAKKAAEASQASAAATATAVQKVKTTLADTTSAVVSKLNESLEVSHVIHGLVNNDMHRALVAILDLARWKAGQTGNPEDEAAADRAKAALDLHDDKQAAVDASAAAALAAAKEGRAPEQASAPRRFTDER